MLRFLSIRHLAVIDRLELEFEPGLNVLTGETGAGKSILVGAVGLLVGGRASADLVRTGEDTAAVEAIFETPDGRGTDRPAGNFRAGTQPRVRRRRARDDRRAPRPVCATRRSARPARAPGAARSCSASRSARRVRRPSASSEPPSPPRSRAGSSIRAERERLLAGRAREGVARGVPRVSARRDRSHRTEAGEDDELAALAQVLANADKLQRLCARGLRRAVRRRRGGAAGARRGLEEARGARSPRRRSRRISRRATRVKSQLEDLAFFLRRTRRAIDASPARLQEVEDRLAALDRLKKKHGPALDDVMSEGANRCGANCTTSSTRPNAPRASTARWPTARS